MSTSQISSCSLQYTVYGCDGCEQCPSVLRFSGQRKEPATGHYLLGNGYRAFNPVLMRFHSPDSLSPLAGGGINCYAYCGGDPVNYTDPSGYYRHPKIAKAPTLRTIWEAPETPRSRQQPTKLPSVRKYAADHTVSKKVVETINNLGRGYGDQIEPIMNSPHWSGAQKLLVQGTALKLSSNIGENLKQAIGYPPYAAAPLKSSNSQLIEALAVVAPLNEKMQASAGANTLVSDVVASWLHDPRWRVPKVRDPGKAG
ncbi:MULTISPECIES: RHS repeat-associated core domain-containing protein [Pseudomonas]|uniref:RHS repeat-associated core domain-containing protein n=1 Tax=Pseudomonas TaxID=286 RepID=UPI0009EBCDB1|nr:RHS repeat-associated core domain-containing protein [Pseudomonas sp. NBRC 111132]